MLVLTGVPAPSSVTVDESSYKVTRRLLMEMNTRHTNAAFLQLFKEAAHRRDDLLQALNDSELCVGVGAQVVIKYSGLPDLEQALAAWSDSDRGRQRLRDQPALPYEVPLENVPLRGDPVDITRRQFENKRGTYRILARNLEAKTVLVEADFGDDPGDRWHDVLRADGKGWRRIRLFACGYVPTCRQPPAAELAVPPEPAHRRLVASAGAVARAR
jgi:hypothetical protein